MSWYRIPPADKPVAGWHVSPLVDMAAYHFSWLWILVPLALAGEGHPQDYLLLWTVGMTLSFVHRHYTMPYVYLDKQVFAQHVTRFTLFMYLLMLAFVASAFLSVWRAPASFFGPIDVALVVGGIALAAQAVVTDRAGHKLSIRGLIAFAAPFTLAVALGLGGVLTAQHRLGAALVLIAFAVGSAIAAVDDRVEAFRRLRFTIVIAAVALAGFFWPEVALNQTKMRGSAIIGMLGAVAAGWNVWHTLMQKFGILRMYAAKSTVPVEKRTPAWVDKLLVFSWFPFLALWVGPAQRDMIARFYKSVTQHLLPVIDVLTAVQPFLLPPAIALVLFSIGAFLYYERRADGLKCWPRLSMALALTLLNASFLVVSPLKVYIAYGFSHAVEYMVFVWAFLRRRYAAPLPHRPVLQRILKYPWIAYGVFTLSLGLAFFYAEYGKTFGWHEGMPKLFDVRLSHWIFSFAIWHSIAHFYFDGFLWKMRLPQVRASL